MRVVVDLDLCTGHGICESFAPEVFEVQDVYVEILADSIDPALQDQIARAVSGCPMQALRLIEGDTGD